MHCCRPVFACCTVALLLCCTVPKGLDQWMDQASLISFCGYAPRSRFVRFHSIINSLGSLDDCEVQAAIYAADRFSSRSGSFTTAVCPILAQMIQDLETPTELKVKLAGLFRHAHHDISTVRAVAPFSSSLQSHPAQRQPLTPASRCWFRGWHCIADRQNQSNLCGAPARLPGTTASSDPAGLDHQCGGQILGPHLEPTEPAC